MVDRLKKEAVSFNRIRKSKSEIIKDKLGIYFKQRNYVFCERSHKPDFAITQGKKHFVLNRMMENDFCKLNSFLFSNALCFTNNYLAVDIQFSNFVKFVASQVEPAKSELKVLFGPLICHLYIELIKCREWRIASEFLKKYTSLISEAENFCPPLTNKINGCSVSAKINEDHLSSLAPSQIIFNSLNSRNAVNKHFKSLMQILSTCLRIENIEANESLVLFRSAKYDLEICVQTLKLLKQFLENRGHVIILNIIQSWISIEITELQESEKIDEFDTLLLTRILGETFLKNGEYSEASNDKYKKKEKDECSPEKNSKNAPSSYFRRIKHSAIKLQNIDLPIRNITILDKEKKLTCSSFDLEGCHISGGFEDSIIKLWHINRDLPSGRNMYSKNYLKHCNWSAGNDRFADDIDSFEKFDNDKTENHYLSNYGVLYLKGHTDGITDILFSKKHSALLSVSKDKSMRFWDSSSKGKECQLYIGHNHSIWCLCESTLDSYIATGSQDLTAKLWSLNRKFPLITYVGHTEDVESIAFHPNSNYIATGSNDLSIRLWCVSSGRVLRVFSDCKFAITKMSFSPDGKFLAVAGEGKSARLYDLAAGSLFIEFKDHSSHVIDICWSDSGKLFVTACSDGSIRLWNVITLDTKNIKNTTNKLLCGINSTNKSIKVFFDSLEMITLITAKYETESVN